MLYRRRHRHDYCRESVGMTEVCGMSLALLLAPIVAEQATRYRMDPHLVNAVILTESRCRVRARSKRGALGLMQIIPAVDWAGAAAFAIDEDLMKPMLNVSLGTKRLAWARKLCGGHPLRWLSAYNGRGCGASWYSHGVLKTMEAME